MKPDGPLTKRDKKRLRDAAKFAADMDGDTLADRLMQIAWALGARAAITTVESALFDIFGHEVKFRLSKLDRFEQKHRHRR